MVSPRRRRSVPRKSLSRVPTTDPGSAGEKERLRNVGEIYTSSAFVARWLYDIAKGGKILVENRCWEAVALQENVCLLELERSTPVLRRLPRRRPPLVDDNTGDYFYYALKITTDSSDNSDSIRATAWSSIGKSKSMQTRISELGRSGTYAEQAIIGIFP
ncbi:hypothetical protein K0M31_013309 [Melipona bicolor]|uniref:Uncharacterized protein n=1 Tax=Melipona bicolor TaxID=60889 RepID=A0AA40KGM7_9HYME|nr:hypothetical protein K0M31_013309 [Melipona bicolor]